MTSAVSRRPKSLTRRAPTPDLPSRNRNFLIQEIQKRAHTHREISPLTCVHCLDLFTIARIKFLKDWHKAAGLNIPLHLKASQSAEVMTAEQGEVLRADCHSPQESPHPTLLRCAPRTASPRFQTSCALPFAFAPTAF